MNSGWIVAGVIILAVLAGGFIACRSLKKKAKELSMAAFGTESFAEGLKRQADVLAETPKSVSGMTRIFEPQIRKDFPDFNLSQFRNRVENMLTQALCAVSGENPGMVEEASAELVRQVENRIACNRAAFVKEVYANIRIHQTEVTDYVKKDGKCIITFQSAVEHIHYTEYISGEKAGQTASGDKNRKEQTKYNTELMYIQDEKLSGTGNAKGTVCPNCGAPVTKLSDFRCEYCGMAVTPVNLKVWTLHRYYEVDYRHV